MKKQAVSFMLCAVIAMVITPVALNVKSAKAEGQGCYKSFYSEDYNSGTKIAGENEFEHFPIASMCKIMTLLLCFEEISEGRLTLDEKICASENASGMGGSQVFLEAGADYSASDLIKSICVASANDSCVAMAERIAGGEEAFVQRMNERAAALGMENTVFINCTGLPGAGQYSCAADVARMLRELMKHEEYFAFSKIWTDKIVHPEGRETEMANTNKMIRAYTGCDAGKTGFTNDAGFCLAASAMRGNMRVISVVIGADSSKTRFNRTREAFDYAFANYTNKIIFEKGIPLDERCPVQGGKISNVSVKAKDDVCIFTSRNDHDEIFYELEFDRIKAPVKEGDAVGKAFIYKNNIQVAETILLSNENVKKISYFDSLRKAAEYWIL